MPRINPPNKQSGDPKPKKGNTQIIARVKNKNETKKGVVKDSLIHKRVCNEISKWFETIGKSKVLSINESPIKGPKGNTEFLISVKYQKERRQ